MARAGCRQVLIGLEAPDATALRTIELKADFKAQRWPRYRDAVRRIQGAGITVNGCFILGLDGHTANVFEDVLVFANELGLYEVQVTYLTAFPGTPLYERLVAEGRVLEPGRWDLCTLFDVNHEPGGMTPDELREGMYWLTERLYSKRAIRMRREAFFERRRQLATSPRAVGAA